MNPFNPSFGKVPPIFLDRDQQVAQVVEGLQNINSPFQTTLIYGIRGAGKTSFLTDVSKQIKQKDDWIVVNLAMDGELISTSIASIYDQATSSLKKILDQIVGIEFSVFGIQTTINTGGKTHVDEKIILENMLRQVTKQGLHVLITLDEVRSTEAVRKFILIYQILSREELNVSLIMTGLPNHVSELQNDDVLTFLLRSARVNLSPLDALTVRYSYQKAFIEGGKSIDDDALELMTKLTVGYAYAFQLLGYLVWETSDQIDVSTVQSVVPQYQMDLTRNVYLKIYQSLSPTDQLFVQTMAQMDGDQFSVGEIGQRMQKPKNYVSMYRRRLLDDQIITSSQHGYVRFALPLFKQFVNDYQEYY